MKQTNIFIDGIWTDNINEEVDINLILDSCAKEYQSDENGVSVSNIGGWQSKATILSNMEFEELFSVIQKRVNIVASEFLKPQYAAAIGFQNAWININNSGDFNKRHTHPGALLSGVFYVSALPDDGNLVFEHSSDLRMYHSCGMAHQDDIQNNELTCNRYELVPSTGMLVIFPSWMPHMTRPVPQGEDRERISISFNCSWVHE
jgi:uncharacterized protein (TIGR02466 family)